MPRRSTSLRNGLALGVFAGVTALAAVAGALVAPPSSKRTRRWYQQLRKPPFQPPPRVFAPVWSGLYTTVAWSGYRTWRAQASPARSRALRWWAVQLGFNGLWSPLFFGMQRPKAALVDSALLLSSAARYARLAAHVDRAAAYGLAPYVGWLTFAFALNAELVRRNPRA